MYRVIVQRRDEADAGVREQAVVEMAAPFVAENVVALEVTLVVGKVHEGEAGAVRHHDLVVLVDAILLGHEDLAQPIVLTQPGAEPAHPAVEQRSLRRRDRGHRVEHA